MSSSGSNWRRLVLAHTSPFPCVSLFLLNYDHANGFTYPLNKYGDSNRFVAVQIVICMLLPSHLIFLKLAGGSRTTCTPINSSEQMFSPIQCTTCVGSRAFVHAFLQLMLGTVAETNWYNGKSGECPQDCNPEA